VSSPPAPFDRYDRGLDVARQFNILPAIEELARIAPDLSRILVEHSLGDIVARSGLDLRTRQVASVAMLAALGGCEDQLAVHLRAALDAGLEASEVVEVLMQVSTLAGYPRALNAVRVAGEIFKDRRIVTPLAASARAVASAFLGSLEIGDITSMLELVHPDVRWEVPGDPSLVPWVGDRRGREAVRDFYSVLLNAAEREDFGIDTMAAGSAHVFAAGHVTYAFPHSGGRYHGEFVCAFVVRDGLISRYTLHEDSQKLAHAYASHN